MFIRTNRVQSNDKTYVYRQLVRSFRDEEGKSRTEVICNLKEWNDLEIQNLERALEAARQDRDVVVAPERTGQLDGMTIANNYDYLDVAVLMELWTQRGFDELLDRLVDDEDSEVDFQKVVQSLVMHRCIAPGSKLSATRWFPNTALPELLDIGPDQFNNSRIHRVLERLEEVGEALQRKLPAYLRGQEGNFSALFLDVTDTWFEGAGGELAVQGKTKEGMVRKKVGIVLMCSEDGYPLAWRVVSGNITDDKSMVDLLEEVCGADWLKDVPLIVDRAMGTTASIDELRRRNIRYVTALRRTEFASYTDQIPSGCLADIDVDREDVLEQVIKTIKQQGFEQVSPTMYLRDLGLIDKQSSPQTQWTTETVPGSDPDNPAADFLAQGDKINEGLQKGKWTSLADVGRAFGRSKAWASNRSILRRITDAIRSDIKQGGAPQLTLKQLKELSRLKADKQPEAYHRLKRQTRSKRGDKRHCPAPSRQRDKRQQSSAAVRGVLHFNPEQFVEQRRDAQQTLGGIYRRVFDLNRQAREGRQRADSLQNKIRAKLKDEHLLNAFEVEVYDHEDGFKQLQLNLIERAWKRRRQYDGFSLVVADPSLKLSPRRICRLYRDKNAVELDFHKIKGFAELRPVYHQTDAKIRAHVIICMLAVLLERTLHHRLGSTMITAPRALEELAGCHLNRVEIDDHPDRPVYTVTRPGPDQEAILRLLEMGELVDEARIQEEITEEIRFL